MEQNREINFTGYSLEGIEYRTAHKKFEEYKNQYNISQLSDIQLLEELIYRETLQDRFKKKISEFEKKNKKEEDEG